jgi:hypothetical protein
MNAEYLAALGTGPFFLFLYHEIPDAEFLDIVEVFDHAHAVPGSVPRVQTNEPGTGITSAGETVFNPDLLKGRTVLDRACNARF